MTKVKVTGKLAERTRIEAKAGDRVVLPLVKLHLLEHKPPDNRDPNVIHASEMSAKDWCDRSTWYRLNGWTDPGERFSYQMESIWEEGNALHRKWQGWLRDAGLLWGDWHCAVCPERQDKEIVSMLSSSGDTDHKGWHNHQWQYDEVGMQVGKISGHEDAAIPEKNRLIEFKSMALGSLRVDSPDLLAKFYGKWYGNGDVNGKMPARQVYDLEGLWKSLKQPLKSWVRQANIYLWLARELALDFPKVSIVAEYKINQDAREWVIPMSERIVMPLIERAHLIETAETPVECPYGGCKQCRAWENANPESAAQIGSRVPARRIRHKGDPSPERAGAGPATTADWRNTGTTRRSHRVRRQCPDEAVHPPDRVAGLPGDAASHGRGG
jgi:hypothetical protein